MYKRQLVSGLTTDEEWPGEKLGRSISKRFLCDVVHNCTSGIDVDKLDYLVRDSLAVFGAPQSIDALRIIFASRIVVKDTSMTILAYDENAAISISQVYDLRTRLHRQVYQHRNVLVVEGMIKQMFRLFDAGRTEGNQLVDMVHDAERYVHLTDATIRCDPLFDLNVDHRILRRIPVSVTLPTRPLCKHCGHVTQITDTFCTSCGKVTKYRAFVLSNALALPKGCTLKESDIIKRM